MRAAPRLQDSTLEHEKAAEEPFPPLEVELRLRLQKVTQEPNPSHLPRESGVRRQRAKDVHPFHALQIHRLERGVGRAAQGREDRVVAHGEDCVAHEQA